MENRLYPRVATDLGVFLKPFDSGFIRVWIRDVSIGGLRVAAPPLRRNTLVEIIVPHRVGMVSWIDRFKAQVIWVDDGEAGLMECEDELPILARMKAALVGENVHQGVGLEFADSSEPATQIPRTGNTSHPLLPKKNSSTIRK